VEGTAIQVEGISQKGSTVNVLAPPRHLTRMTQINDTSHNIDPLLVLGKKSCGFAGDDWNH
jgi:hypothetical protein